MESSAPPMPMRREDLDPHYDTGLGRQSLSSESGDSGSEFEPPEDDEEGEDESDDEGEVVGPNGPAAPNGPIRNNRRDSDQTGAEPGNAADDEDEDDFEPIETERIPASLAWYQRELNAHTLRSQKHYAGLHSESYAGHDFKSSVIGSEVWSGKEKAAFFASLARHSRWRPELIASECGKSEFAVRLYIEQLERGRRAAKRRPTEVEDSQEVVEVSTRFVEREEGLAAELLALSQPAVKRRDWGADLRGKLGPLQRAIEAEEAASITLSTPAEDDVAIAELEAIPKLERTQGQRSQLRHLLNRKRNRTAYRRKILLGEGWTDERIQNDGGADAVFEREQEQKAREKRPGARRKTPAEIAAELVDVDAKRLKDHGAVRTIRERGLDVFDYHTMALLLGDPSDQVQGDAVVLENGSVAEDIDELDSNDERSSQPNHTSEAVPESIKETDLNPSISLPVLSHLYAEMLAYLKPLIYQAIVIAEAQSRQERQQAPGELTGSHVLSALRLRDELDVEDTSAPSTPTSSVIALPGVSPSSSPRSSKRRLSGSSSGPRVEAQLPTWADFPPPPSLPPSTSRSPLATYAPLTPTPRTPTTPNHSFIFAPETPITPTTPGRPRAEDLPSFPIAHPEPTYIDEGTDEEDIAIEAALRRYHKSADRAWDRMYAHGLRTAGEPSSQPPTPSRTRSRSRRTGRSASHAGHEAPKVNGSARAEGPQANANGADNNRSAGNGPGDGSDVSEDLNGGDDVSASESRQLRKKEQRELDKIDRATSRAELDWTRYASIRDTLLRRREKRRAQLRRLRGERAKKRRKLKPVEEIDDDGEAEIHLPAQEKAPVLDEVVGTTEEEDELDEDERGWEDAKEDYLEDGKEDYLEHRRDEDEDEDEEEEGEGEADEATEGDREREGDPPEDGAYDEDDMDEPMDEDEGLGDEKHSDGALDEDDSE